jgi:hypothetical protein
MYVITNTGCNLDLMLKKYKGKSQLFYSVFSPLKHKYPKEARHGKE